MLIVSFAEIVLPFIATFPAFITKFGKIIKAARITINFFMKGNKQTLKRVLEG